MASIPELNAATARHQLYIERLKTQIAKQFDPFLRDIKIAVEEYLESGEVTEKGRTRLAKQLKSLSKSLTGIYAEWFDVWLNDTLEFAEYEAGFEERSISRFMTYDFSSPSFAQVSAAALTTPLDAEDPLTKGKLLKQVFKRYEKDTIKRINRSISAGAALGRTNKEIMRDIRSVGLVKSKKDASLLVRTGTQHVATTSKLAFYEQNSDVIKGYKLSTTIDRRTTRICRSLGQKNLTYDFKTGPKPPFHLNCRTTIIPEVDGRFRYLKKGATRPARGADGVELIPQSQGDYAFLKTQSFDYVASVIGKKRAKLLLNGGLSADRFAAIDVNEKFQPLTLDQMKLLEPTAFKRAGID